MKTTSAFPVAFFGALIIAANVFAQTQVPFMVIKVGGKVYSELLKRNVKTGDVINNSDKLSFASKESYLHVINPNDGQKAVRNIPDTSPRELVQLFDKFLDQKKNGGKSRGSSEEYLDKLTEQLSKERLVILGNGRIVVDTSRMRLRRPSGVKVMYEIDGKKFEKVISDPLGFNLGKSQLFSASMSAASPKTQLFYYEDLNDPAFAPFYPIGFFTPVYPDENFLVEEVNVIVNAFRSDGGRRSIIFQEILTYIVSEYGDPIESNLREWLEAKRFLN